MTIPADPERVLTLDDLRHWKRTAPSLAVIGHPIAHSRSPAMHNAALAAISADRPQFADWVYFKFDLAPEELAEALPLFHKHRFVGLNLTLPHKVDAVDLVSGISSQGRAAGAVNTLHRQDAGYYGHNTDGSGFARACEIRLGKKLRGADIVLLGAGGAARAVGAAVLEAGCRSLLVVNRDPERLTGLLSCLAPLDASGVRLIGIPPSGLSGRVPSSALIVNATSLGLKEFDASPFPAEFFRPGMAVYDTVYGKHETALVREARASGLKSENGLSMLCWQGALALELWTRTGVPVASMWSAVGGSGNIE